MGEKLDWFPIDSRIFPVNLFFLKPSSGWVRIALFLELFLAFISIIGALILTILPQPKIPPSGVQATTKPAPTVLPECRQ